MLATSHYLPASFVFTPGLLSSQDPGRTQFYQMSVGHAGGYWPNDRSKGSTEEDEKVCEQQLLPF